MENKNNVIINDKDIQGKKINPIPKPSDNKTGLSDSGLASDIITAGDSSKIDISQIQSLSNLSTQRDKLYQALETMANDIIIAAALKTYAEDATETNQQGDILWCESDDDNISKYVSFLIKSMQVNKNIYKWVYSLCKYGDLFIELFKETELDKDEFFDEENKKDKNGKVLKEDLKEDININVYGQNDHFTHYVEMVQNPAEMFELTRFGKTKGFIKSDLNTISQNQTNVFNTIYQYSFKKNDINIYNGDKFVHGCLEDSNSRIPEEVSLFRDDDALKNKDGITYTVKRGQSLLYDSYKIWRIVSLLDDSLLLNRLTKSSIVRMIQVQIGDMPKEEVRDYMRGVKDLVEQKTAINESMSMNEYNNPGPVVNNIYVPVRGESGQITTNEIGGDVNVGQLTDIDYFTNKLFGSLRIPKQYFGFTEDGAGFNGGQSLAILSSRYAKMIKRIQSTMCQVVTDIINIFLIDKGYTSYIGKFTIHMQPPTTQEEIDRRENASSNISITRDIMELLSDVQDEETKLKILKSLLSNNITNTEVISLIQDEIDRIKNEGEDLTNEKESRIPGGRIGGGSESEPLNLDNELGLEPESEFEETEEIGEVETETEEELPTPEELDAGDFVDNSEE